MTKAISHAVRKKRLRAETRTRVVTLPLAAQSQLLPGQKKVDQLVAPKNVPTNAQAAPIAMAEAVLPRKAVQVVLLIAGAARAPIVVAARRVILAATKVLVAAAVAAVDAVVAIYIAANTV